MIVEIRERERAPTPRKSLQRRIEVARLTENNVKV